MTKRAAIYIRQSTYHDGSISEELQEKACRDLCEREGWEVVGVYKDIDISGTSTENRPGLQDLRASFDRAEFDVAVAHASSRFARNMQDGAAIVAEMPLATVLEGVAPTGDDDFMPLLHMLLAHKQSKEIGKRWREVHESRVSKGQLHNGRRVFGYNKDMSHHETEAPVVREMFQKFNSGMGYRAIASWINDQGFTTPMGRQWSSSQLSSWFKTGIAAGYFTYKGERLDGSWTPIIDETTWRTYEREIRRRSRKRANAATTWFLAGLVKCGLCGGSITRDGSKNGKPRFGCVNNKQRGKDACKGQSGYISVVEKQFGWWLGAHIDQWAAALPERDGRQSELATEMESAREALGQAQEALGRLTTLLARGIITEADYLASKAELAADQVQAQSRLDEAVEALADTPDEDDVLAVIESRTTEDQEDPAVWGRIISRFLKEIRVWPERLEIEGQDGKTRTVERRPFTHRQ